MRAQASTSQPGNLIDYKLKMHLISTHGQSNWFALINWLQHSRKTLKLIKFPIEINKDNQLEYLTCSHRYSFAFRPTHLAIFYGCRDPEKAYI